MKARLIIAVLGGASLAACKDLTVNVKADSPVRDDTLAAFVLTGSPLSAPTALNTFITQLVRADPAQGFDVAFDTLVGGQAVLYPAQLLADGGVTAGILRSDIPFDQLLEAPRRGYNDSTATPINRGDVLVIQAQSIFCRGQAFLRPDLYSKLAIDSIVTVAGNRLVYFRIRVDPNCGFRSFRDGVPEF